MGLFLVKLVVDHDQFLSLVDQLSIYSWGSLQWWWCHWLRIASSGVELAVGAMVGHLAEQKMKINLGTISYFVFHQKGFYLKGFHQNINKSFVYVRINRMNDLIWALVHFFMTFFADSCFVNTVKTWKCFNDIFTGVLRTSSCIVAWKNSKNRNKTEKVWNISNYKLRKI